jgi:lipoprotein-releasing system permease protein
VKLEYYIAKRITFHSKRTFSRVIVRIAISAIALSMSIMLISIAIVKGFQKEIKNKVIGFNSHIQITHTKINYTFENEPLNFDQVLYKNVKETEDVNNIQVFANKAGIIKANDQIEGIVLKGISRDYDWSYMNSILSEGNRIYFKDTSASNDIIVSKSLARKLGIKLNDQVVVHFVQQPPRARKLRVSGIFETGIEEIDQVFALCDIVHIQKINNWKTGQIGGYEVVLKDINKMDQINEKIRLMAGIDQDTKTIKQIYPQIFDWLNLLNVNVRIILILMAIVASVNMVTALLIIILEKTQMIGILKAIGVETVSIGRIFLINAAFLIGFGVIAGDLLALILIFLQDIFKIFKLPMESYYMNYVPVYFSWIHFLLLNAATFVFCTLMMLLPSAYVAKIDPVKTIRFQ